MLLSSDCIRSNPHHAVKLSETQSISIDDTFLTLDLLSSIPERTPIYQPSSVTCHQCGAYLSPFTQSIVENEVNSGRVWRCAFCNATNESDVDVRSVAETGSMVYDLVFTSDEIVPSSSSTRKCVLNIIACDTKLLSDEENLFSFLSQTLSDTPETSSSNIEQFVSIVFFDQVVRVPRLTSLISAERPIEIDIFDNRKPISNKRDLSFLQQGLHIASRQLLQPYLYRLQEICEAIKHSVTSARFLPTKNSRFSFSTSRRHRGVTAETPTSCIDGVFSLTHTLVGQLQATAQHAQVTFLTSQSLFFHHQRSSHRHSNVSVSFNLCRIGARHMSCPSFLMDCVALSGGHSLTAESVTDTHFLCDAHRVFSPQFLFRHCSLSDVSRHSVTDTPQSTNKPNGPSANNLCVWVSGHDVGVSVVTGEGTVSRRNNRMERHECRVSPVNNDSLWVTCQLFVRSSRHSTTHNTAERSEKDTVSSSSSSGSDNWVSRAIKYLKPPPLSSTSSLLPTTSNTTSNTTSESSATPPPSSSCVLVMLAFTVPHCDYDTLSRWQNTSSRDTSGRFHKVVRVFAVSLPLAQISSRSSGTVSPPYWTLCRTSLPLYLAPPNKVDSARLSDTTVKKSAIRVSVSSGDLWVLGVSHMVSRHYETQLASAASDKDTQRLFQENMQVVDHLAAQLMKRLCVLHQMYHTLRHSSGTSVASDGDTRYDTLWLEHMMTASYEGLWGLYGYRSGPLWTQNQILAKNETALLNFQVCRNRGSLARTLGMLRPRLWLVRPKCVAGHSETEDTTVVSVSPETTHILSPETAFVAALFCGDFFAVSVLRDTVDETAGDKWDTADVSQRLFGQDETLDTLSGGCPVTKSVFLETAGTPRDRLMYSRLSPRHSDTVSPVTTVNNNTNDRSTLQDIVLSVQDTFRVLWDTQHSQDTTQDTVVHTKLNNIRQDIELCLSNNNNVAASTGSDLEVKRFHQRRHLPVVSDSTLSFHRYLLSHVFALVHKSETTAVSVFTEQQLWKQVLTVCEQMALRTQAVTTQDLQLQYVSSVRQRENVTANHVVNPNDNSHYTGNIYGSQRDKVMKSETIQLSDRGQAATDTNV